MLVTRSLLMKVKFKSTVNVKKVKRKMVNERENVQEVLVVAEVVVVVAAEVVEVVKTVPQETKAILNQITVEETQLEVTESADHADLAEVETIVVLVMIDPTLVEIDQTIVVKSIEKKDNKGNTTVEMLPEREKEMKAVQELLPLVVKKEMEFLAVAEETAEDVVVKVENTVEDAVVKMENAVEDVAETLEVETVVENTVEDVAVKAENTAEDVVVKAENTAEDVAVKAENTVEDVVVTVKKAALLNFEQYCLKISR